MKKLRVFGHTEVTVSVLVEVDEEHLAEMDECDIFDLAAQKFGGIGSFAGNGGIDKLIGVCGSRESIDADNDVEFDDYMVED